MADTQSPPLQIFPGKPIRLADPDSSLPADDPVQWIEVQVEVENGVLPPGRAPAVKTAKPATANPETASPETANEPAKPARPETKPEGG